MVQEAGPGIEGQGDHALDALKGLLPRTVFQQLFAVKAQMSLSAAAAVACSAADNDVLLSGVREVQQLVNAELSQPLVSKHQLTRLCQVCDLLLPGTKLLFHCLWTIAVAIDC